MLFFAVFTQFLANMLWAMAVQHLLTVPTLSEMLQLASVKRRSESDSIFIELFLIFPPSKDISPTDSYFLFPRNKLEKEETVTQDRCTSVFFLIYHDMKNIHICFR